MVDLLQVLKTVFLGMTLVCLQVSYVIETSDAFLRRKKTQLDLPKRDAERKQKFHNWYRRHADTMIPAYAAALGFMDQHL